MLPSINLIYFNDNNQLKIDKELAKDYMIKIPTMDHRYTRSCSACLTVAEIYELKQKKGLVFIDISQKKYSIIPLDLLESIPQELKSMYGVKNSLKVYKLKEAIDSKLIDFISIEVKQKTLKKSNAAEAVLKGFKL